MRRRTCSGGDRIGKNQCRRNRRGGKNALDHHSAARSRRRRRYFQGRAAFPVAVCLEAVPGGAGCGHTVVLGTHTVTLVGKL